MKSRRWKVGPQACHNWRHNQMRARRAQQLDLRLLGVWRKVVDFPAGLRFHHFAAAQAGCANSNALGSAFHPSVNRTQIYIPAPLGHVVGVTDVISKLRSLAAKIAYLCH